MFTPIPLADSRFWTARIVELTASEGRTHTQLRWPLSKESWQSKAISSPRFVSSSTKGDHAFMSRALGYALA